LGPETGAPANRPYAVIPLLLVISSLSSSFRSVPIYAVDDKISTGHIQ